MGKRWVNLDGEKYTFFKKRGICDMKPFSCYIPGFFSNGVKMETYFNIALFFFISGIDRADS